MRGIVAGTMKTCDGYIVVQQLFLYLTEVKKMFFIRNFLIFLLGNL